MVFDSSWPSLPIAFETKLVSPFAADVTHNLKFASFACVWAYAIDPSGIQAAQRFFFPVDTTKLYFDTSNFTSQQLAFWLVAGTMKVRCFQLDLSTDIDYILAPGDTFNRPYDKNFGIKVVKQGKDINSTDLRDFALHSRAQSPLILAVKTEKTVPAANVGTSIGTVVQYNSNLKYPAWVYGYVKQSTGKYVPAPYYSQAYPRTFTDGILSYIGYTGTDIGATLVVLRDPMFAPTSTTVQY